MTAPFERHRLQTAPNPLERIVDALRVLRIQSHKARYGDGPTPELPSRKAIVEIVDNLASCLFPRHYGPHGLVGEGVDGFILARLDATLQSLRRQISLELALRPDARDGRVEAATAAEIVRQYAEQLPRIRALLESDIHAAYEGDPSATSLDEVMCCYPGVTAIIRKPRLKSSR